MVENCNAENLYNLVIKNLKEVSNMNDFEIVIKLICVGADGAIVMQGQRNGICIILQTISSPYLIPIHCMAHRLNLSYNIISVHNDVAEVKDLIRELYSYFMNSFKRLTKFQ